MHQLGLVEVAVFRRAAACGLSTELGKGFTDFRRRERFVDRAVEPLDDVARGCGLNGKSDPILDHEIGESFLDDRRYVLERWHALGTSHSQRAQFAGIDEI